MDSVTLEKDRAFFLGIRVFAVLAIVGIVVLRASAMIGPVWGTLLLCPVGFVTYPVIKPAVSFRRWVFGWLASGLMMFVAALIWR